MEVVSLAHNGALLKDGAEANEVLQLLPLALSLDSNCTLRSFFAMLRRYPLLQEFSEFLPAALKEAESCPPGGCVTEEFRALVLGKSMELIGFPGKPRAEIYTWLRGLGLRELSFGAVEADYAASGEGGELGRLMQADKEIRFIPLAQCLDTPLELGGMKHVVLGDVDRKLFCETRFTLFEVVDGIAWEFGFRGGPAVG